MRRKVASLLIGATLLASLVLASSPAVAGRWMCTAVGPAGYQPETPNDKDPSAKDWVKVKIGSHKGRPVIVLCGYYKREPDREP
jgi:hypothetical protein